MRTAGKGVAAVNRALTIVSAFDGQLEPVTLAELSRRTGLFKSTLLRLLASLEGFGYVVRHPDGRYHLGPTPLRLGCTYQRSTKLGEIVMPIFRDLVAHGAESPSFHVRHDREQRLCVFRLDSHHSTVDTVVTGAVYPLARGAAGKVILAFDGERGAAFDEIRRTCLGTSYGERNPECAGLACPVFDREDRLAGALSLSGPKVRFTRPNVKRMTVLLFDAAIRLTQALGGDVSRLAKAKPKGARRRAA